VIQIFSSGLDVGVGVGDAVGAAEADAVGLGLGWGELPDQVCPVMISHSEMVIGSQKLLGFVGSYPGAHV
jgi:hypothetical protein